MAARPPRRPREASAPPIETRYRPDTTLVHGRFESEHWNYSDHIVPPISASAAYRLQSAGRGADGFREFANPEFNRSTHAPIYIYDRLEEPSRGMLEENLAMAEGGERAVCFATGMAAVAAAIGVLTRAGDRVLAHRTLYGCSYSLFANWLPRWGVTVDFLDMTDPAALAAALAADDVMAVYFETPCNPTLELIDLSAVARAVRLANGRRARRRKGEPHRRIYTVVDNTFATPYGQRPLKFGIDMVVHSLTKNLGGFGTDMGGAVVAPRLFESDLLLYRKDFGAPLSPRNAWPILVYGLPSLAVRMEKQQRNALAVAQWLQRQPAVASVVYPGLRSHPQHTLARRQMRDPAGRFAPGILVSFTLTGTPAAARVRGERMMDDLAKNSPPA